MAQVLLKSCGDLDSLKVGDHVFTPALHKEGNKYVCDFDEFEITKYLSQDKNIDLKKVNFDKYDVELKRIFCVPDSQVDEDSLKSRNVVLNLRNGFCTKECKNEILDKFSKEISDMKVAIDSAKSN
jgi:hypothetical protein